MRLQQMNQALSAFSRCVQQDMEIGESRRIGRLPSRLVLILPIILNPPFFILSFPIPPLPPSLLPLSSSSPSSSSFPPPIVGEAWANIGAIHMHERAFEKALHGLQEAKKHKPR